MTFKYGVEPPRAEPPKPAVPTRAQCLRLAKTLRKLTKVSEDFAGKLENLARLHSRERAVIFAKVFPGADTTKLNQVFEGLKGLRI